MRNPLTYLAALGLCLLAFSNISGQTDSLVLKEKVLPRPMVGVNTGFISFFGDVGNLNGLSRSPSLNFGHSLSLHSPLTDNFSVRAFAFFGRITEEERIERANANFSTPIRMGGLSLNYNFGHFLPEERWIEPYIGIGISTFEFNPKSDAMDANGNTYHYWSDGTIRSLPEDSPEKSNAVFLERDYSYESDLRETKEERYPLRGLTAPVSVGANIKVNDFFTLNMGTEFHYSFTDNLDNVSEGGRSGNDHFMFSSIGLMYNLKHRKSPKNLEPFDREFENTTEFEDEDQDGVVDLLDDCPFTETDMEIDEFGCPIDSDKDGVPDHIDLDPFSEEGIAVNLQGEPLTDKEIESIYLTFKDSIGNLSYQKSRKTTDDFSGNSVRLRDRKKGFRIMIKNTDNLSGEDISRLLSVADVKSMVDTSGVGAYYVGEFSQLAEAVSRRNGLEKMNYETEIVYHEFGDTREVNDSELALVENSLKAIEENSDDVLFRVQIGAYRYRLSENVFKDVDELLVIAGNDGLVRYVSGSFDNIRDAAEHKIDLLLMGFEGAFVTAYRGGKRISLKEAGARVKGEEKMNSETNSGGINSDLVKYSILLGTYKGRVPADALGKFIELDGVRPMRGQNGTTKYVYKSFADRNTAAEKIEELKKNGFENAELIGIFNGNLISAKEADRLKKN